METNSIDTGGEGPNMSSEKNEEIIAAEAEKNPQETAEIKVVQAPQNPPTGAKFGGFKIGAGKTSTAMRDALGGGTRVSNNPLPEGV